MSINVLHKIAEALGTAAAYMDFFEAKNLLLFATKIILVVSSLGGAYVLYAFFYLNEPLLTIFQSLFNQVK